MDCPDCPEEENKKEQTKEQSSPSKDSGACTKPGCEELKRKYEACEKELEEMRKKIKELEETLVEKEQARLITEETLTATQMECDIFKKDFEEERKDRERAHQQLEALRRQPAVIPDRVAESLQAEVLQATQQRNLYWSKIEDCKVQYGILWKENERLKDELDAVCFDKQDLEKAYYQCQQDVQYYRVELEKLKETLSQRSRDPERNYTLKDQLDIANLMNNSLQKEKEDFITRIEKLVSENRRLRQQLSAEHERNVFSPDDDNYWQYGAPRPRHDHTQEYGGPQNRRPPSQQHVTREFTPPRGNPESISRVHTSPQMRNRDSADQRRDMYDVCPNGGEFRNIRSASDGDMRSFRQEHWDQNGFEDGPNQRPLRAGPKMHTYANVPDPASGNLHRDMNYERCSPLRDSREGGPHYRNYPSEDYSRYSRTLEYISLQVGDLSEAEKTSVKEFVDDTKNSLEEELTQDIELMCRKMKDLRYDRQECIRTDLQRDPDPNLVCPNCRKQFRLGEIQKYRKHTNQCGL